MVTLTSSGFSGDQPTEEGRYSFGTTPPIDKLLNSFREDRIASGRNDAEEIVLINLATLIRNRLPNISDNTSMREIAKLVVNDTAGIANEFINELSPGNLKKCLIFYSMEYERQLPEASIRPDSQQRAKVRQGVELLKTMLLQRREQFGSLEVGVVHSTTIIPSFAALRNYIAKFPAAKPKVRMISHIALDYHIFRFVTGEIVKSHTGDAIPSDLNAIGEYVFKYEGLPFTVATHLLFGDKELVKGSLGIGDRKKVLGFAAQENWASHTVAYIEESLNNHNIELPIKL